MDISDDEKREMFVRAKDYSDPPKEANRWVHECSTRTRTHTHTHTHTHTECGRFADLSSCFLLSHMKSTAALHRTCSRCFIQRIT